MSHPHPAPLCHKGMRNKMQNIIHQTKLTNGIKIELLQSGCNFIVKDYYSDGSKRDVKFFGNMDSAGRCFNNIIDKENAEGGK